MRMRAKAVTGGLSVAVVIAFGLFQAVDAKTLRWSSQGDITDHRPARQNEGFTNSATGQVYEPLVTRDKDLKLEPCLATSWKQENADTAGASSCART